MTVAASTAVPIICAYIAYRISIREARREIAEAFEQHIEKLHAEHVDFVEAVKDASGATSLGD